MSTDEVYGSLDAHAAAFQETTAYAPNSPYAASKAASDHLMRAYHHTYGLPILTTNCSNNYGPFHFPESSSRCSFIMPWRANRYRSMATASKSETGCMSRTTAAPCAACWKPVVPARHTMSAATTKEQIWKSRITFAICSTNCSHAWMGAHIGNRSYSSPIGQGMIDATQSIPAAWNRS